MKKFLSILLLLCVIILICSCKKVADTNNSEDNDTYQTVDTNNNDEGNKIYQAVEETLSVLNTENPDVERFKQLLPPEGLIFMTTYFWKDQNKIMYVDENYAQDFLYYDYINGGGYWVSAMFTYSGDVRDLPIQRSDHLNNVNFNFDWNMCTTPESSYDRDDKIRDLVEAMLKENDPRETQIFVLADETIAYYESYISDEDSEYNEIRGTWAVWQKKNDEYQLRMIFHCYD